MTSYLSHREKEDHYHGELFRHGRFRVVVCKNKIQWIVQRNKSGSGGGWLAFGYFLTSDALIRLWTALGCPETAELSRLPPKFRMSRRNSKFIKQEGVPAVIGPAPQLQP